MLTYEELHTIVLCILPKIPVSYKYSWCINTIKQCLSSCQHLVAVVCSCLGYVYHFWKGATPTMSRCTLSCWCSTSKTCLGAEITPRIYVPKVQRFKLCGHRRQWQKNKIANESRHGNSNANVPGTRAQQTRQPRSKNYETKQTKQKEFRQEAGYRA